MAAPSPIMNQPAKTPHISRIDQPTHRTHGFFLRVSRDGHIYSAFFADQTYGGREQALAAASMSRWTWTRSISCRRSCTCLNREFSS